MFGSRLPIAVEGAYVGSVQNIEGRLASTPARCSVGNGVEGTLRVNLLRTRVQPYLFGGMGWTHYQVTNSATNTSSIRGSDDIGTVPLGAGLSARLGRAFILDIRGTYRATFADDLLQAQAANRDVQLELHAELERGGPGRVRVLIQMAALSRFARERLEADRERTEDVQLRSVNADVEQ